MRAEELKQKLIAKAKEIGIDKIGFTTADPFIELRERLIEQQEKGYHSGFEEPDIEKRVNPERSLPEAKTIIAIALAYPSKLKNPPRSETGAYRGIFCRASWGEDYHHVLRDKLAQLEAYLHELVPGVRTQSMVDTGALSDRAVAERAGIGWSGKNTAIITEEFGSWVYLGEMITDVYIPSDEPATDGCGGCNRCVDACPTGALVQPGQLNAKSCIAYLTQTKGFLPDEYRTKIGNRLYGCDTCQTVCPKNRKIHFDHHQEFQPDPEKVKPLLKPLLSMSNREFKEKFGRMSGSWRGKKPIQRNAIIALAHFNDKTAVPDLIDLLHHDPRPVIRGTAAWALGKIGGEEAKKALVQAEQKETDKEVQTEIKKAMGPEKKLVHQ
ncbi:tRNA epoxyqueuosine(34) reductase QueG [Paenactinomyces guangxiensis]|uniref:Epoxyqueuosine reductase n=1 Tax=Paenactinomyces guangxiensis TaxID=1490290 RepID=A0A7W1WP17_9BACL|nr:tRNA epoxyqueuosine(34) reductase QueG [Paenactinomyces guangxiensis]MBA4493420.1 tRNA epoxyqueuosine(34) reductase QueG [Paenactinomyces guangxiensis]MBH8590511.1 tRNA epoxyqueuosine(34) reductase QueG [Paenactinomyces guangxiensis]